MSGFSWDAAEYRDVSNVQFELGRALLARHEWKGGEHVLDVGCGTGALMAQLVAAHPEIRVVALDNDPGMVAQAREMFQGESRVDVLEVDVTRLPEIGPFDVVFSNAVLHWVQDHGAAFGNIHRVLAPGGRFLAQCGGTGNLAGVHEIAGSLIARAPFAEHMAPVQAAWNYQDEVSTLRRLKDAGFDPADAWLEPHPTPFETDGQWERFLRVVTLRVYLHALDPGLHDGFLAAFMEQAERSGLGRRLDFMRLTIDAYRPS